MKKFIIIFTALLLWQIGFVYAQYSGGSGRGDVSATVNSTPLISPCTSFALTSPSAVNNSRCSTGTVTLSVTGAGGTYKWYSNAGLTTQVGTGASFTTPSISSSTSYYVTETDASGCVSSTITVTATVNTNPTLPTAGNNSRCGSGTVSISATPAAGETIDWYVASSGGTASSSSSTSFTTPSISSTTIYYAEARNTTTGCVSATRRAVTATINSIPSAPSAGNNSRCGTGTVSISATAAGGQTIDWYVDITDGAAIRTSSTSYTTPSISSTTIYYAQARNSSTSCVSATRTAVTATVNEIPIAPSAVNNSRCGTGTVTLSVTGAGGTYKWYSNVGLTTQVTTGASFTTPSIGSSTNYYVTETNASSCASSATTVTATVNDNPVAPSAPAAQGSCGVTSQNFTFSNVTAGNPGDQIEWATNESFTGSTTVSSPATINVNNVAPGTISTIYIRSRVSGTGCVSSPVSTSATVTLENTWLGGTGNWTDPTKWSCGNEPSSAQNVIINNGTPTLNTNFTTTGGINISGTGGLIIAPRQILTISGTTNFGDRPVTISSDTTGSGAIGQITGTLSGATNVTVERFIPAKRAWRSLTAPLTGSSNNSVFYNWQNNGVVNGGGAIIWNKTGGPGLATGGGAASLLRYDAANNTWSEVTNTQSEPLFTSAQNNSFLLFVSGPYNTLGNYIGKDAASTTLRATGTLRQGTIDFSLSGPSDKKRLALIGNPYASSVLFETVSANSTGIEDRYWAWDPGPKNSNGAYKLFEKGFGWVGGGRGDFGGSGIIPSGQAIFVRFIGSGLVRFTESSKSTNVSNTGFRLSAADPRISINLNQIMNNTAEPRDAAVALFIPDANAGVDDRDAVKLSNFSDNLSLLRNGSNLTLERRPTVTLTDTMYLRMWGMSEAKYQLAINPEYFGAQPGVTAVLQDAFLGTESVLPLTEATNVSFDVTSNMASSGNRFRIVLRSSAVTSVNDLNGTNKFAVYPNPVVAGGALQFEFRNATAGKYTIAMYNMLGMQVLQQMVNINGGSSVQSLSLPSGLSAGTYIAECMDADGKREKVKVSVY